MASGDDDDPIIQEIDVYLARSLVEKLYLFQYPVRPASMSYDNVTHLAARIKPKQQKVSWCPPLASEASPVKHRAHVLPPYDGQAGVLLDPGDHEHVPLRCGCVSQRFVFAAGRSRGG
uniref:Uncharacterized protein n=1 Tax=Cyprinus carpio TaxID=7962 RepID=A0A8C1SI16_CYPCA